MHDQPHPGKVLREYLTSWTVTEAAERLGVHRATLSRVVNCTAGVSAKLSGRLGTLLGTDPEFWVAMQIQHDLDQARHVSPTQQDNIEGRMLAQARWEVLSGGELLRLGQLAELTGMGVDAARSKVLAWQRSGRLFTVSLQGVNFVPRYALDPHAGFSPYPVIADVIRVFGGAQANKGWRLAFWFASANSMLNGDSPKRLLKETPGNVLAAAQDEAFAGLHG